MAELLQFPRRQMAQAGKGAAHAANAWNTTVTDVLSAPFKPFQPSNSVDDWGRDPHLIGALSTLSRIRWDVTVGGQQLLPKEGPALLVANARYLSLSSLYASWALSEATGRTVRFVGRPDVAPVGALMRRFGALLTDPDEIASALRNGQLVMISAARTRHPRQAGAVDHSLIATAVLTDTPVFPVATMSSPVARSARVEVGPVERLRRKRRGPLAEVELAQQLQERLQELLEELGGLHTGVGAIDFFGEG